MISSPGGDVTEGLNIAAFMRTLPAKIITHNIGQTDSVANVIFAAGTTRYATENSSFLFHGVSMNLEKQSLIESQLAELHKNAKRLRENIAAAFAAYTGLSIAATEELMISGGTILTAAEAKEKSIINDIRDAKIPAEVQFISIGNA